jgi:hypothetical protein
MRNPDAAVACSYHDVAALRGHKKPDLSARGRIAKGVVEQVLNDLREPNRIRQQVYGRIGQMHVELVIAPISTRDFPFSDSRYI